MVVSTLPMRRARVGQPKQRYVTLPRYLSRTTPTVAESFESAAAWSGIAGSPTIADNTTALQFSQGSQSVKVTTTAGSGAVTIRKTGLSIDVSQGAGILLNAVNHHSANITLTVTLWVTPTSKGWQWAANTGLGRFNANGWNNLYLKFDAASVNGGALRSETVTAVDVTFTSPAIGAAISLDNLMTGADFVPAICLCLHDTWLSHYTIARPMLQRKGGRASVVLQAGGIAGSGGVGTGVTRMTYAQVNQLVADGWTPLNHGTDHTSWNAMANQAAVEADLSTARADLIAGGVPTTPVSSYFSYPGGEAGFDTKTRDALVAQGYLFGHGSNETGTYFPYPDMLHTGSRVIGGATHQTLQGELNTLAGRGGCGIYVNHDIAPSGGDITAQNLALFIDWANQRKIPLITWDELYRLQSGSVTVPVPW